MKKLIFCFSVVCMGLLASCVDKNELVDEDSRPSWLGGSIYEELQNPGSGLLQGSFKYYLQLVEDLGSAEDLKRTGSLTIFPANDEAFERFFASGTWEGVHSYKDLTDSQKKILLKSSMLNNAMLVDMLSNATSNGENLVDKGRAVKHHSTINVIDTITHYSMPFAVDFRGNTNWQRFDQIGGISVVSDATTPMIVHFTYDYLENYNITPNDFSIITGRQSENTDEAYVYDRRIIAPDVTCQNGYIHQVDEVIVPPGNMAQALKGMPEASIFSHMLDRFAVPRYNEEVTNNYHDWYNEQSKVQDMSHVANPDSIYEIRYLSGLSHGAQRYNQNANGAIVSEDNLLTFDPGWNEYSKSNVATQMLNEIGAMFVPTDEAMKKYFVEGEGAPIMDRYKYLPNTPENVIYNVDSIPQYVVCALLSNLMKASFADNVPSKFPSMIDDAADHMDMEVSYINKKADGAYNVKIANNGVIYMLDKVVGPKKYVAVSAPTLFNTNLNVIRWIIENRSVGTDGNYNSTSSLDLDFYAYLLAMTANYALFMPTDEAFNLYYVDPASLYKEDGMAEAIHYYTIAKAPGLAASRWRYDTESKTVTDSLGVYDITANLSIVRSHLVDIMNYHTVVLNSGETLGFNKYYKTKHGGEIMVTGGNKNDNMTGAQVYSGGQIDNGLQAATITEGYNMENGKTYIIDRVLQGPQQSVYQVLESTPQFSDFYELCNGFEEAVDNEEDVLSWAGISGIPNEETGITEQEQYKIFYLPNGAGNYNVKMFNSYNYTVYVPNNDAMQVAYTNGLPKWSEVMGLWETYHGRNDKSEANAKERAKTMIAKIRDFARYHFQITSVYADNVVEEGNYSTYLVDSQNRNLGVSITGSNGKFTVTDEGGYHHVIDANGSKMCNRMARDFVFDKEVPHHTYFKTSSFSVVHELSEPLYYNAEKKFGTDAPLAAKSHNPLFK